MRLIDSGICSPRESVLRDTVLLDARAAAEAPDTLHLYRRDRPTVSLGRFSRPEDCLRMEALEKMGAEVVRRPSGGSCIYTDSGQMIYSLTVSADRLPPKREDIFPLICGGLVEALRLLGIEAVHKPINDVLVDGEKISGSAQARRRGVLIQQGTLIVDLDLEAMDSILIPLKERSYRGMTSLREQGVDISWEELAETLRRGFSQALGREIREGVWTPQEESRLARLRTESSSSSR